jgi:hypothetical protein
MSVDAYTHEDSMLKVANQNGHRRLHKIEAHSNVSKIVYGVCTRFLDEKLTFIYLIVCV